MNRPDPLSLVGEVLDGTYRIESLVGEGGFGVVYRAFHLGFEEPVAVKCLKIPGALSPQTREAFLRKFREEGKLLFQLSKGTLGIVRSIALGDITTKTGIWAPYVVLEWLEGEALSDALRVRRAQGFRGRPLGEVLRWLDRPARALAYAHDQRVAHRDIKPANLFILRASEVIPPIKILDFGIAKAMEHGPESLRKAGLKTGFTSFTPQYAAPEQFDPNIGPTGPWTDVYQFALVVVEMLTDRIPVEGDDAISLMSSTLNPGVRPTPRSKGLDIPEAVERVFARALSIEPDLRFADAGGLWDAMRTAASQGPASISVSGYKSTPAPTSVPSQQAMIRQNVTSPSAPIMTMPATSMPMPSVQVLPTPLSIQAVPTQASIQTQHSPIDLNAVPTTGTASAPILYDQPKPPKKRRLWLWLMFGVVVGIALMLAFGVVTCTTCVCVAL